MKVRAGRLYPLLIVVLLAAATAFRATDPFFLSAVRLAAFDSYQRLDPAEHDPELPVRVVDIDEESLARIGQWPWSRTVLADMVDRLAAAGAAAIVFDVLFAEADQSSPEEIVKRLPPAEAERLADFAAGKTNDQRFAESIEKAPTVLATVLTNRTGGTAPPPKAGFAVAGDDPSRFVPAFPSASANLPALDAVAQGLGAINWRPDRDQVIRRLPLLYRAGEQYVPALAIEALRVGQGASTYVLKASNASGETAFGQATGLNHIRVGSIEVPTDADGGIWLKFRPSDTASYVAAWKVLDGSIQPGAVEGRIVLIGTSAAGLGDIRATPLDAAIPGVEIHEQAIEHILAGRLITRPDYALAMELVLTILFGLAVAAVLPRLSARGSALVGAGALVVIVGGAFLAYTKAGLLLDPSYPGLTLAVMTTGATAYIYRRVEMQRGEVRRAFSQYVSPAVVDEIIADPQKLELGGVVRELTLMFCDVRDFTGISERMTAHELTRFINSLLTPLTDIILEERGTIDKYMGDAIMAFWNAPLDDPEHARHACGAALRMLAKVDELNAMWRAEAEVAGRPFFPVKIGIGISSGACCVGNLGSSRRFDYSAIGDEVNVASRLEGLSKFYGVGVVVGEAAIERGAELRTLELDLLRVKGRNRPTRIFTAVDALRHAAPADALLARHEAFLAAYRGRDWDAAEAAIAECRRLGASALDLCYQHYLARIADWRKEPPPADWDGAYTALAK